MPNCLSRLVEPRNSVFEHYSLALQKCRAFFFFANKSILKISMLYVFLFAGLFAKTSTLIHSLSRIILNFTFIFCVLYFVFSF